jgi:hypothetical protein
MPTIMKKTLLTPILLAALLAGSATKLRAQHPAPEGAAEATSASATEAPENDASHKKKPKTTTTTVTEANGKEVKETVVVEPKKSRFSGDLGLTILNQYNTRGIIVQSHGVVYQPYVDIYLNLYKGDGFINSVNIQAGLWGDLCSDLRVSDPTKDNATRHFTELDFIPGASVTFLKRFTFTLLYNTWVTPAGGYNSGEWLQGILAYDDSNLLFPNFSFQPVFKTLYELPSSTPSGLRGHGWYFEPSLTPNYTFFAKSKYPVNLGLNFTLGLGSQFYAGETFGYFAFGPQLSVPLGFIPSEFGKWTVSAGYRHYVLGETTAAIAPGGRANQELYSLSLGLQF